jgi:hypothetical protein
VRRHDLDDLLESRKQPAPTVETIRVNLDGFPVYPPLPEPLPGTIPVPYFESLPIPPVPPALLAPPPVPCLLVRTPPCNGAAEPFREQSLLSCARQVMSY